MRNFLRVFLAFAFGLTGSLAELIPANRKPHGGWVIGTNVGVIGGIVNRTTISDDDDENGITDSLEAIDDTGSTDVAAAIQAACDSALTGEVVRLPAGDFRCDATINLAAAFNGKTLRGAGSGTRLLFYCNQGINAGSSSGYFIPTAPDRVLVTDGLEAGSTEITVSGDISYLAAGSVIRLNFPNRLDPFMFAVYCFDVNTDTSPHVQVVKVISKVGQVLEIFPPLYDSHEGEEVRVHTQSFTTHGISIEDMTVDMVNFGDLTTGSYSGVSMHQVTGGWIKNVKSIEAQNYGIIMANCVNSEVRGCWAGELKGGGSNGAGLLFSGWSCLVEDNVLVDAFPGLEVNAGSSANVFSYNYSNGQANTNHAPHNRYNLHEGNAWHHQMSDGYFGSESDLTLFRCYFWGGNPNLRRFNRNTTVIGSIMLFEIGAGHPFISSLASFGTAQLSLGDPWRDYNIQGFLLERINDTTIRVEVTTGGLLSYDPPETLHRAYLYWGDDSENGIIADVTAWDAPVATMTVIGGVPPVEDTIFSAIGPGSYGGGSTPEHASFPEMDLDVAATLVEKGNYRVDIATMSSLGGDTLNNSEIYASKPTFFGDLAWPPYDPANPGGASIENIPAGYRFANGEDPGSGANGTINATNLTIGTGTIGL